LFLNLVLKSKVRESCGLTLTAHDSEGE
jgi:hypothetical protein